MCHSTLIFEFHNISRLATIASIGGVAGGIAEIIKNIVIITSLFHTYIKLLCFIGLKEDYAPTASVFHNLHIIIMGSEYLLNFLRAV